MAEVRLKGSDFQLERDPRPKPGDVLCMIPGPTKEIAREPIGERWCFGCRARLPHDRVVLTDEQPSYYDPVAIRQCSRCGEDRTRFPG